jgi:hypothetical protein
VFIAAARSVLILKFCRFPAAIGYLTGRRADSAAGLF